MRQTCVGYIESYQHRCDLMSLSTCLELLEGVNAESYSGDDPPHVHSPFIV